MKYESIRRFVSHDNEFWTNVATVGKSVEVCWGEAGSRSVRWDPEAGQQMKVVLTDTDQEAAFDLACSKLSREGYTEISPHPANQSKATISAVWHDIETWLNHNVPVSCQWPLSDGATAHDIKELEARLGLKLPSDVKASYRRHNGSNDMDLFNFVGGGTLMTCDEILECWTWFEGMQDQLTLLNEPRGPMKMVGWSKGWIPFADNGSGDYLCIDLDPPKHGKRGQVFVYWHEYGAWHLLADSFTGFLQRMRDLLDNGFCAMTLYGELATRRSVRDPIKVFKGQK